MKRKFDEISNIQGKDYWNLTKLLGSMTDEKTVFGPEAKRRRLESQKIGDFIVDA